MAKATEKQRGGVTGKGFKPGQSGNPKGRQKGSHNRSTVVKKWLTAMTKGQDLDGNELDLSYEDKMALKVMSRVLDTGDPAAFNALMDSAYGKAIQHNVNEEIVREPVKVIEVD